MKKKRRAFTLIELIIGLSVQLIIMGLGIKSVIITFDRYNYHKEIIRENEKMDEAILTIYRYINKNMIDELTIDEINNEIKITLRESHSKEVQIIKKIKFNNLKSVTLESYKGDLKNLLAVNVILRDAEKFDIVRKGEIYYLIIKTIKGEERILCL